jgi:hypothetical protein
MGVCGAGWSGSLYCGSGRLVELVEDTPCYSPAFSWAMQQQPRRHQIAWIVLPRTSHAARRGHGARRQTGQMLWRVGLDGATHANQVQGRTALAPPLPHGISNVHLRISPDPGELTLPQPCCAPATHTPHSPWEKSAPAFSPIRSVRVAAALRIKLSSCPAPAALQSVHLPSQPTSPHLQSYSRPLPNCQRLPVPSSP